MPREQQLQGSPSRAQRSWKREQPLPEPRLCCWQLLPLPWMARRDLGQNPPTGSSLPSVPGTALGPGALFWQLHTQLLRSGFFFFLMFSGLYLKKKNHHGISTGFCHFPVRGNKVNSQGFSEVPGCAKGCVLPGINCQALVEVREALEKQPGKCGASHLPRPKAKNTQGTTSELLQSPLTAAPAAPAPPHREFPQETLTASPPRPARLFSVPSSKEKRDEG